MNNLVIQARTGSTRFPKKVLQPLGECPSVIDFIFKRLSSCRGIDRMILACPTTNANNILEMFFQDKQFGDKKVDVYRGSETNVLQRVVESIKRYRGNLEKEIIIDVTADCPFVCPQMVSGMLDMIEGYPDLDYISNTVTRCWPDGFDVQIYKASLLNDILLYSGNIGGHIEHTGWNILNYAIGEEPLKMMNYPPPFKYFHPEWAITLDTREDYEVIQDIHRRMVEVIDGYEVPNYTAEEIMEMLIKNPEVLEANEDIERNIPGV